MTRIFGHYVSLEMTGLCLVDLLLSFAVIHALAPFGGDFAPVMSFPALAIFVSPWSGQMAFAVALTLAIGATAVTIGLYRPEVCLDWRRRTINAGVAGVLAFPAALLTGLLFRITLSHAFLIWLLEILFVWMVCLIALRWGFRRVMHADAIVRRIVVLGDGPRADRAASAIRSQRGGSFRLVGVGPSFHDSLGQDGALSEAREDDPDALLGTLRQHRVWGVVTATDRPEELPLLDLLACKLRGVRVLDDIGFWEQHLGRVDLDHVDAHWFLSADGFATGWISDALKRLSDLVVSLTILLLTLPVMLIAALLIKIDSRGPVLYRQQRVGLHGKPFMVLKFRSMTTDAEAAGRAVWAQRRDPRVTRVGGFIRVTRIDELPQLFNVLRGEMSFIGPRPERPHFVDQLVQVIPFYRERACVKPGITGWAQVNFPYGASIEDAREKLAYDLYYVKNRGIFLDILILIATVRVILFQEGAR